MLFEIWDRLEKDVDLLWMYPHMISDIYFKKPIPDNLFEMRKTDVFAKFFRIEKEIEEINIKSWGIEKYNLEKIWLSNFNKGLKSKKLITRYMREKKDFLAI